MNIDDDNPFADADEFSARPPARPSTELVPDSVASSEQSETAEPFYPQSQRTVIPETINLLFVANIPDLRPWQQQIADQARRCDLLVSLGGVDLQQLAPLIPADKPSIAVLAPDDPSTVPEPFNAIHGSGFSVRGWKLAGISGGWGEESAQGLYLDDQISRTMLQGLAPCDLFLSYAPPVLINDPLPGALPAIDEYLASKYPLAAFYAHPQKTIVEPYRQQWDTLLIGVKGLYFLPDYQYRGK